MKFKFNEKYTIVSLYAIAVFVICMLLVFVFFRASSFFPYIGKFFSVCAPVFSGIAIAYCLNPIVKFFDRLLKKTFSKTNFSSKFFRGISIFITFTIVFTALIALLASIIPELLESLKNLVKNLPDYYNSIMRNIEKSLSDDNPEMNRLISEKLEGFQTSLVDQISNLETVMNGLFSSDGILGNITDGAINIIKLLENILVGSIIAVYLLFNKEHFIGQMKKMAYSIFKNKVSEQISEMCSDANQIFSNFIFGKAIDSILIGIICFIILSFTPLPYVLLISVIVGCTNMIPVFGPFIGAVPCALLILLSSGPKTMIYFCIFILILQQFDGNILGPKILGNRLGISAFWIMCSVVIGGGLFGVLGMVIAVPIFAFIHAEVKKYVTESLLKKGLPINSNNYVS